MTEMSVVEKVLEYSWVSLAALVGIVYKSNARRLDEVAKTASAALSRAEFELYAEATRCSRKSLSDSVRVLNEGQAKLLEAVSRIEGKLEK